VRSIIGGYRVIQRVITDFRTKASFAKNNEIALFRNLASAIEANSCSTFINETHGKVCNVAFKAITGKKEICEIADLLIVSCAPSGALRATFWQAKKQKKSKWLGAVPGSEYLDFDGQFNQWDLLRRRPLISGIGPFCPPSDLLSSFTSASIGSFGVFYQGITDIEVNHSVAEFVACHNPTVKRPKMSINAYLGRYYYSEAEIIVRATLSTFLEALFSHQVGALLDPTVNAHRWLVKYTRTKANNARGGNVDLRAFNQFLNDEPSNDIDMSGPSDGLSVLIVNWQNVV